jgi:nucleotidyltransferase/DNA polymerase involved in DNA repair
MGDNDSNIIARSRETKALGVPMGAPIYRYSALIERAGGMVCAANFALYGDLSHRVMETLARFTSALAPSQGRRRGDPARSSGASEGGQHLRERAAL